jgi:GT2 family glycosyltransferase
VVILNYESERDLVACAQDVSRQEGVQLSIILVDNASRPASRQVIRSWLGFWRSDATCGSEADVHAWVRAHPAEARRDAAVYLIENQENRGYSAGNNVGLRLAVALGAEAALVCNPDLRIEDRRYVRELADHLFADPRHLVAGSRIVDLEGRDLNPLREATFLEELLWPRWLLRRFFRGISHVLPWPAGRAAAVPKVSGCCMMLRTSFLTATGYLDENVFLYCEEPILAARVRAAGGLILYVPTVSALHAHARSDKRTAARRMLTFIDSRKYYLAKYSGYARWQLRLLGFSYALLARCVAVRGGIRA